MKAIYALLVLALLALSGCAITGKKYNGGYNERKGNA